MTLVSNSPLWLWHPQLQRSQWIFLMCQSSARPDILPNMSIIYHKIQEYYKSYEYQYPVNEYCKQERWQRATSSESSANTDKSWLNANSVCSLLRDFKESVSALSQHLLLRCTQRSQAFSRSKKQNVVWISKCQHSLNTALQDSRKM